MLIVLRVTVSVIVPVYNVEKYLRQCLDTLVSQTLADMEIIVVNDGSPDASQSIIDEFAAKYPSMIQAFIKENGGLGDARNYGIARATGEYIGFVDSDDWVDLKMFETMYHQAKKTDSDVVICDFTSIYDGWESGWRSTGYRGPATAPTKENILLHSMDPAIAWNKLYRKSLFEHILFPKGWYEDIGTTPVLLSYANTIHYLPVQLYYYRQRSNSITSASRDPRTLEVIDSWRRAIAFAKEEYRKHIEHAVYNSVATFVSFKPEYADEYLAFFWEYRDSFLNNIFISKAIANRQVEDVYEMQLIPKKLHYFWFGGNPKSELIEKCMESWRKYAWDYDIIEWNETNCDVHECPYVEEAYLSKKWAFVADYFRMKVIAEHGGFYLDTDMELTAPIDCLRLHRAFFAFEIKTAVNAAIFGAIPHFGLVEEIYHSYHDQHFILADGSRNTSFTIVARLTQLLAKEYKIDLNGKEQVLRGGVKIYPPNVLTLDMYDGNNIAQHHYDASWWDVKTGQRSYKYEVLKDYFSGTDNSREPRLAMFVQRVENKLNTIDHRIAKPLLMLLDALRRVRRRLKRMLRK